MNKRLIYLLFAFSAVQFSLYGQEALVSSLRQHVTVLASDSLSGRGFGFPEKILAVDYITKQFRLAGLTQLNKDYVQDFMHFEGLSLIEGKNILGVIEGSDPVLKHEYIVVGAHYDHLGWKPVNDVKTVYNGADDNASGVASVIEIGKILMAKRRNLKRSVIIAAFDGEEAGLIGSSAFIANKPADTLQIKAMFSLDMVGMFGKNGGIDLNGSNSVKNGEKFVREIARQENIAVVRTAGNIEARTDTWSFGKENIPSFFITTGLLSPYHKPEDDSNLLDYEGMASVVHLISSIVSEMANLGNIEANTRFIRHSVNPKAMIGWMIGVGSNHYSYKVSFYNAKPVLAIETGLNTLVKITGHFLLQSSLTYEMTGSYVQNGKIRMHSITPTFDILISTPVEDLSKPLVFGILGGFYRYNFAISGSGASQPKWDLYSGYDYGIRFGAGMRNMKTQVTLILRYGLKNVSSDNFDSETFNRGICLAVTRYF